MYGETLPPPDLQNDRHRIVASESGKGGNIRRLRGLKKVQVTGTAESRPSPVSC